MSRHGARSYGFVSRLGRKIFTRLFWCFCKSNVVAPEKSFCQSPSNLKNDSPVIQRDNYLRLSIP